MEDTGRSDLIDEFVEHRISEGDWSQEEEEMTDAQRRWIFRKHAETLTTEQLVSACNSYAIAADS
jgi:metal-responsive CopG/Arc/MetJ family transcriptional regulator